MKRFTRPTLTALGLLIVAVHPLRGGEPLGPAFTFQGQLKQNGVPFNGTASLSFSLWRHATSTLPADQVGGSQLLPSVQIDKGLLTVVLNDMGQFGPNAFNGEARWLEVRVNTDPPLTPRKR